MGNFGRPHPSWYRQYASCNCFASPSEWETAGGTRKKAGVGAWETIPYWLAGHWELRGSPGGKDAKPAPAVVGKE